jgi:hypothetical protein
MFAPVQKCRLSLISLQTWENAMSKVALVAAIAVLVSIPCTASTGQWKHDATIDETKGQFGLVTILMSLAAADPCGDEFCGIVVQDVDDMKEGGIDVYVRFAEYLGSGTRELTWGRPLGDDATKTTIPMTMSSSGREGFLTVEDAAPLIDALSRGDGGEFFVRTSDESGRDVSMRFHVDPDLSGMDPGEISLLADVRATVGLPSDVEQEAFMKALEK